MAELAARELARRRLLPFIRRFRPKYLAGWVHEDICRRLERFLKAVERGESPRLLLMTPPRLGKSEIGSRNFPPWVLGQHPDWEIIAASHTASLTLSFSRYIRDLLRDPAFQVVFPECVLDPASQSTENWNLLSGGGYLAAGVGTGITGRGAHILLLDDLVKDKEAAASQTITDNTWEWYSSTAYTRLAPGGGVLGIMTWWSEADWAGRIQAVMESGEGDKFEVVRYPAINEQGDEFLLTDDSIIEILPGELPPAGARMTRPKGTALHPARYDTEAMLRIKRNLIAAGQQWVWNALYQQNPMPEDGMFFTKDMFRYYGMPPAKSELHVYQAWDFAISTGKESDYTVGVTLGQDHRDNLYVLDVRRFRFSDSLIIVDQLIEYAREWDATLLGFEDGQIWKTMEAQFLKRCDELRFYPSYEVLKPLTDKMVRASPLRGRMQLGKVYFDEKAPWFRDLFAEFTRFPAGKHDDIIDGAAWAVRLTLTRAAPRPKDTTPRIKSWKDRLSDFTGEAGVTHMSA
ncbi:phage terminase large subunit [Uliginosibacterium gangwonense]|uniref:phage terminase large subunit n=1 Tax=Uliginosibacterium gangwonense TaxID=392736 RepID=UPI00036A421D|nr:phage terminase large subunit [Uliginosibacterium gangwonense]